MTLALSDAHKLARATATANAIDTGAGAATLEFYAAPRPAAGGTPSTTALAIADLPSPCGTPTAAGTDLDPPPPAQVLAAGDIAWARLKNRAGAWQMDMDAGLAGSGPGGSNPEVVLDAVTVYPGAFVVTLGISLVEGG